MQNILECINQGVVLFDSKQRMVTWNAHYHDILRIPEDSLEPGLLSWDIAYRIAKNGAYGEGDPVELTNQRMECLWSGTTGTNVSFSDERSFDVQSTLTPEGGLVITYTDITERVKAEDALRHSLRLEAVGQLTGGIAHEFNNLMGVMIGNAEVLGDQVGENEKAKRNVEVLIKVVERGASLTQRLLAFSRQQTLSPEPTAINDLIRGLEETLQRTLGEMVKLSTNLGSGVHDILIDPHQFENALVELAINARDAMPNGGDLVIKSANVPLDEAYAKRYEEVTPGDYVKVTISDTGVGIAPEALDKVHEPFFTTKDVGEGSGLGLSTVHGFVKQSNGHVSIDSEIDSGTTINLYLPRSVEAAAKKTTRVEKQELVRGSEHILVVEDDELLRDIATMILEEQGYQITAAGDGKEAIRALNSGQAFDLLFTDIVLPGGMNGAEIAEKAKRIQPNIKIIYATGYYDASVVLDGTLVPGVTLAKKPYDRAELFGMIRGMLDSRDD